MANYKDTVTTKYDVDKGNTSTTLKSIGQDFRNAGTFGDKFKVAAGGAMEYVKGHAVQLAAVGGAALVGFAVKAVGAFTDAATAAEDTGKAMGDSTEAASRWTAVADDFKVSSDAIVKGAVEITKHLDDAKWDKYGITVKDAAGNMLPTGDVLKDILATISKQPTEQDRTRVGLELLGRSYKSLAPLIGHTRKEYDDMLASVEDGQVITEEEAEKARRWELALDTLGDALKEITLSVGEQVAEMAPLITTLVKIIELANKVGALNPLHGDDAKVGDTLDRWAKAAVESGDAIGYLVEKGLSVAAAQTTLEHYNDGLAETKAKSEAAAGASAQVAAALVEGSRAAERGGEAVAKATVGWWELVPGLEAVVTAAVETEGAQERLNAAVRAASGVVGDAKDGYQQADKAVGGMAGALGDLEKAQADAKDDVEGLTGAIEDQIRALQELRGEALSANEAKYAFEAANREAAAAVEEFNEANASGDWKAIDNAAYDAGESIRGAAQAYAESTGAADGSVQSTRAQIDYLKLLAGSLDEGSPLRQRLEGYISDLEAIPESVPTTVNVDTRSAIERLREVQRAINAINSAKVAGQTPATPTDRKNGDQGFHPRGQSSGGRGLSSDLGGGYGAGGSRGGIVWENGEWVEQAEEAADAAEKSVEEQNRAEDDLMRRRKERGEISEQELLDYLERRRAAEDAAGRHNGDYEYALWQEITGIRDEAAQREKELADAAADAVKDAEEKKRDEYEKTAEAYKAALAKIFAAAEAGKDLAEAVEEQKQAIAELLYVQAAVANGDEDAIAKLAGYTKNAAKETFEGAQAQAAAQGLKPGTPEYAAFIQGEISRYLAEHPELGGAFAAALQQQVSGLPTSSALATLPPVNVTLMLDGQVLANVLTQPITTNQQRRLAGNT